jgi:signal transduction histidine kinase
MTTAAPPSAVAARPSPPAWQAAWRDVPIRFYVLAVLATALLLWGGAVTPVWRYFSYVDSVQAFIGAMWRLGHLLVAVAPLVALRWPGLATVTVLVPAPIVLFGGHHWPFVGFVGLVAVAMVSMWRSPRFALLPAAVALLGIVVLLSGSTTMVMPYGAENYFGYQGGSAFPVRLVTFGMFVAGVAAALGVAYWMRSSAVGARRAAFLEARSAEVEGAATVVGERARLARDLHDVVAHHVSLIAVRAETAPYTLPDLQPDAKVVLADIAADARTALDELRGVLGILRRAEDGAADRAPQPTLADVAALVQAARTAGEQVVLDGDLAARVGSAQGYVAYRVVQEALTNARRHAPGRPVTVAVVADGPRLRVRVTTPYLDASADDSGARRGLVGMRERVEALGGQLDAGVAGDLFVVEADLPRGDL